MTLNIKTQKRWKYKDDVCVGCGLKSEDGDELINCKGYGDQGNIIINSMSYSWFFGGISSKMFDVAKVMMERLKKREKLMEEIDLENN